RRTLRTCSDLRWARRASHPRTRTGRSRLPTHARMRSRDTRTGGRTGVLSMARGGYKDGATASFFICLGDAPHLDMEYGIFGWVLYERRAGFHRC
ncbi:hypothetical protein TSOC_012788, partial [Tetrabaena socialis]